MKSFGVDAEWIPGEERRHRLEMTAMKPSGNYIIAASVAGRHRRSAESARTACPSRWVGSRGGWALRGVRTGSRDLALGLRGSKSQCKKSGPRIWRPEIESYRAALSRAGGSCQCRKEAEVLPPHKPKWMSAILNVCVCLLKEHRHWPLQNQARGSRLGSL